MRTNVFTIVLYTYLVVVLNTNPLQSADSSGQSIDLSVSSDNSTPEITLALAAKNGDLGTVKNLINQGIDINCKIPDSMFDFSYISFDIEQDSNDVYKADFKKEVSGICTDTALNIACKNNNYEVAEELLYAGAYTNVSNDYGCSPLYYAAVNGNADLVRLLLDCGAEPDYSQFPYENFGSSSDGSIRIQLPQVGFTSLYPIMAAIKNDSFEIVKLLLEADADPEVSWREKFEGIRSPLSLAIDNDNEQLIKLLEEYLENKAN